MFLVNEVADEVDLAIASLTNNDLLGSCTYQGERNDWKSYNPGVIYMTGNNECRMRIFSRKTNYSTIFFFVFFLSIILLFKVDMSEFGFTKLKSIKTWLSCSGLCAWALGSNNHYRKANKPDEFKVYISQKDKNVVADPDFAAQHNYVLHFEVEGTCENEAN